MKKLGEEVLNFPRRGTNACKSRKSVHVHILLSKTLGAQMCFRIYNIFFILEE